MAPQQQNWHNANYQYGFGLHEENKNAKAERKGYGKGAKSTKSKGKKRTFEEMDEHDQWWLQQFWDGRLWENKVEAAAKCSRIEASSFTVDGPYRE